MVSVRRALGDSMITEELKGDFAAAEKIARQSIASGDRSAGSWPDLQLDFALVQILQGCPGAALEVLDAVAESEVSTPNLRARYASLRNLAVYVRFNTFPGGEGAGGAHLATVWNASAHVMEAGPRWANMPLQECDPRVAIEARLLHETLCNLKSARTFVVAGPWVPSDRREEYFQTAIQVPSQLIHGGVGDALVAFGFFAAADLCRRGGQPDTCQAFLDRARQRYEAAGDAAGAAICWMLLGDILSAPFTTPLYWNLPVEDVRDVSSSISQELLEVARAAPAPNIAGARRAYQYAQSLFSRANAQRGIAAIRLREAYLASLASTPEDAAAIARDAADKFTLLGDAANAHLARVHDLLNRIQVNPFERDPRTVREIGAWGRAEGSVSWALGLGLLLTAAGRNLLQEQGDSDRSMACYRHAQELYEALGAEINVAQALVDRAEVHRALNEADAAISLLAPAADAYAETSARAPIQHDVQLRLIRLFESIYWLYSALTDAEGMDRAATRLRKFVEERWSAPLQRQQDDETPEGLVRTEARNALRQSAVMIPLYRAKALADQGLGEEARPWFQQALDHAGALGGSEQTWMEAVVRGTMRDFAGAARLIERRFQNGGVTDDDTVAVALRIVGRASSAAARQMANRLQCEAHINAFYFLVQLEAFDAAAAHLKIVEDQQGPDWWQSETRPWESLVRRAELRAGQADFEKALEDIDRCVELLESSRTKLFRDTQRSALSASSIVRRVYTVGIRCAHQLMERRAELREQWLARTYAYAETGKARALLDSIAAAQTAQSAGALPPWMIAWREFNTRLSMLHALMSEEQGSNTPHELRVRSLENTRRELEERLEALTKDVATQNPRFATLLRGKSSVSPMSDVTGGLPRNSLLLQYHFADNEFFAWAMDRDDAGDVRHESCDARHLGREIRDFHAACSGGGDWRSPGAKLSERLLAPFRKRLERADHLIVVPFGHLHRLPFHALPLGDRVLGETHSISYLPSGSVIKYLETIGGIESAPVLSIGNPANMTWPSSEGGAARAVPALPFAALEAWYVASVRAGSRHLVGEDATLANVKSATPSYRLLHFATHGLLDERVPLSSAILLANGDALTPADFLGIGLAADLVVLSGCRTGLGDVTPGDEVVGLTQTLLASGTKAAVVSLWPVRDAATSYFMRHFYKQLLVASPARALQRAQLFLRQLTREQYEHERQRLVDAVRDLHAPLHDMSRDLVGPEGPARQPDYSHPYFWAPFVFVGAG